MIAPRKPSPEMDSNIRKACSEAVAAIQEIFARHGLMDAARLDLMTLLFAATATAIASSRNKRRPTQASWILSGMLVLAKQHLEKMLPNKVQPKDVRWKG